MGNLYRSIVFWLILIFFSILLYNFFRLPRENLQRWNYTRFLTAVENGEVEVVTLKGSQITGQSKDKIRFETYVPDDPELIPLLRKHGVIVQVEPPPEEPLWKPILVSWLPMILFLVLWIFMIRQMQAGGKVFSFGKARIRLLNEMENRVTFSDVAGVEEAKEELKEIVDFLKDPKRFARFGGRIPKGVLLIGPPGTGKTLLARAVAGEAGVPFFTISGSDFVEMFVGVGASRVRDLFSQAKRQAPCIIFIDEIDAVGRHRGAGLGGGHDEREQTLNQLLVEMDGFEPNEGIILLAATNRPDVLDPALLRPGRFDRRVVVPLPDWKGRKAILEVHIRRRGVPIGPDVDLERLAKSTPGFSGADIENLVNEAALIAARTPNLEVIPMEIFEKAKDKVLFGTERRSLALTEKEKKITAYHEAGHALVAKLLPEADPVQKVTIIPHGLALGVTQQLPEQETHTHSRSYLETLLAVLMGGRAAEMLVFRDATTGAASDIQRATEIARKMVCEWGMSEKIGPLRFGLGHEEVFLGRDLVQLKEYSEATASLIDQEVQGIVRSAYEKAYALIETHRPILEEIVQLLLERETISGEEIDAVLNRYGVSPARTNASTLPALGISSG
jgi:cell division protease FtsH